MATTDQLRAGDLVQYGRAVAAVRKVVPDANVSCTGGSLTMVVLDDWRYLYAPPADVWGLVWSRMFGSRLVQVGRRL